MAWFETLFLGRNWLRCNGAGERILELAPEVGLASLHPLISEKICTLHSERQHYPATIRHYRSVSPGIAPSHFPTHWSISWREICIATTAIFPFYSPVTQH